MTSVNDPIQIAFESAIRDFRAGLKNEELYRNILQTTGIEQVYDTTDKLQEEQARTGRLRHLSKIEPFLEGLRSYASVIEVFMQAKPDVLALIWGPIKLLLQWADVLKKSFDAIIETTAEIGSLLPEFRKSARLFGDNVLIKEVLVLFFRDMLDFYLVALNFFSLPRLKIVFEPLWPRHKDKIKVVINHIQRHTLLLRNEVRLEHIQAEYDFRHRALEHFEKAETSHRQQEFQSIRTSISPRTYEEKLEFLDARRCSSTGKWLLRHDTFLTWLSARDNNSKVLWLHGIPGSGKTYLASMAMHDLRKRGHLVSAFLSHTFSSTTSALTILHSLIFQLAADDTDLQTLVCQSSTENFRFSLDAAKTVLSSLLSSIGPTYIAIDGLDEIDNISRCRLLKCLLQLISDADETRLMITCRSEADIAGILNGNCVTIRADEHNAGSIHSYIKQHMRTWFKERDFFPEAQAEMEQLLAPLASKSKGMFLYAKVVLSSIKDLELDEIKNDLTVLPETLDDAYRRILERINNSESLATKEKARRIVGWIGVSPTPLTIHELEQALVVRVQGVNGSSRVMSKLSTVRLCGPIVEEVNGYVEFVHFTVKEFFFSSRIKNAIDPHEARLSLTACCIGYLSQHHHESNIPQDEISENIRSGLYRLHEFGRTMWLKLIGDCMKSGPLSDQLIDVLNTMVRRRRNSTYDDSTETPDNVSHLKTLEKQHPELHKFLCCSTSFQNVCEKSALGTKDGDYWTKLDPLTISQFSYKIHEKFSTLISSAEERNDMVQETLKRHYGERLFKCGVFGCAFRRHGFESRILRDTHMKQHSRPWKCSIQGCEFQDGGFLSRKMRDEHLDRYHLEEHTPSYTTVRDLDLDEKKSLLFDFVKADEVAAVKSLLSEPSLTTSSVSTEFLATAAEYASPNMLEFLITSQEIFLDYKLCPILFRACIARNNVENFCYLLNAYDRLDSKRRRPESIILAEALRGDGMIFDATFEWVRQHFEAKKALRQPTFLVDSRTISRTEGDGYREHLLLSLWKLAPATYWTGTVRTSALVNVASTTCSTELAKYLIGQGVPADSRASSTYITALAHASRKTSASAAELMKYLLFCGAEPEIEIKKRTEASRGNYSRKDVEHVTTTSILGNGLGARGISKWLGVSWEELVAQAKEKRQGLQKAEQGLDTCKESASSL